MTRPSRGPFFVPLLLFCAFLVLSASACAPAFVGDPDKAVNDVVATAESLFRAMKERDYPGIWKALSSYSKDAIVASTAHAIAPQRGKAAPTRLVRDDFEAGGPIAREYWGGYLEQFDPDMVLEKSRWEEVALGKERAQIRIVHERAKNPALIQLFRENGAWKVGLVETFGER